MMSGYALKTRWPFWTVPVHFMLIFSGCERPLDVGREEVFDVFSTVSVLSEPELITPRDGAIISTTTQATLRWRPVSGAVGYRVHTASDDVFREIIHETTTDTTLHRTPPLRGSRVYWRVRALGIRGTEGPWSVTRVFFLGTSGGQ